VQVLSDAAGLQVRESQAILASPRLHERPQLCVATETQAVQRPERDQPVSAADAGKRVVGLELAVQRRSRTGFTATVSRLSDSGSRMGAAGRRQMRAEAVFQADKRPLTSAYTRERGACPPGCQVVVLGVGDSGAFAHATVSPGQWPGGTGGTAP
jgi:hypothetical protein